MQKGAAKGPAQIHSSQMLHTQIRTNTHTHCTQMHPIITCRLICLPGSLRFAFETHTLVWVMLNLNNLICI